MKLEDQVCSLELAKRLKELGVKQSSLLIWWKGIGAPRLRLSVDRESECGVTKASHFDTSDSKQEFSAFTVAELGRLLSHEHKTSKNERSGLWYCDSYSRRSGDNQNTLYSVGESEADARA